MNAPVIRAMEMLTAKAGLEASTARVMLVFREMERYVKVN